MVEIQWLMGLRQAMVGFQRPMEEFLRVPVQTIRLPMNPPLLAGTREPGLTVLEPCLLSTSPDEFRVLEPRQAVAEMPGRLQYLGF